MHTLTIKQPWASLIMSGRKRVENRGWKTDYRGPLAIHAGKAVDPPAFDFLEEIGIDTTELRNAPTGVVLGTVELVDIVEFRPGCRQVNAFDQHDIQSDPFACGPFCWILSNPRPLAKPIPARGRLVLWDWNPS